MRVRKVCYFDQYVVLLWIIKLYKQNSYQVRTSLPLEVAFNVSIVPFFFYPY
jgi:hypothetical protein